MINMNMEFDNSVKRQFETCRKFMLGLAIATVIASLLYLLYWGFVAVDNSFLSYSQNYFSPLAKLLCPYDSSISMYAYTSFTLFLMVIPIQLGCYIIDKIEDLVLFQHNKLQELKEAKQKAQALYNYQRKYDDIQNYSICLSLDYKAKRALSQSTKEGLNNIMFSKLKNAINSSLPEVNVHTNGVLIITSHNFNSYDKVYSTVLDMLAKIKNYTDQKYEIEIIPSLTTDAYINRNVYFENIKRQHFNIQGFDFKNKACATATFAKKYKHINNNKYAGVPIGEYAVSNDDSTYELNIVYDNLNKKLASL